MIEVSHEWICLKKEGRTLVDLLLLFCILAWIHCFLQLGEFTAFHNQWIHLRIIWILRWIHCLLICSDTCSCAVNSPDHLYSEVNSLTTHMQQRLLLFSESTFSSCQYPPIMSFVFTYIGFLYITPDHQKWLQQHCKKLWVMSAKKISILSKLSEFTADSISRQIHWFCKSVNSLIS